MPDELHEIDRAPGFEFDRFQVLVRDEDVIAFGDFEAFDDVAGFNAADAWRGWASI
jgi:hypothetical protein